ncbi:MAG: FprA family A-type flavoprotein [Bacillota bacterium]
MDKYWVPTLKPDLHYVGSRDWDRRMFDALVPLPEGTTYNSYLIVGEKAVALVDTVNPGFEKELLAKVDNILGDRPIDYVVMNHAEPDHAGSIPAVLKRYPEATVFATSRGIDMAATYFGVTEEKSHAIADGETLDLGGKTLRFIEAPMLHWPETMFTYVEEDRTLLTCDFFGAHTAAGLYSDEDEDYHAKLKRYFGEIMMPYRRMADRALGKISDLDIDLIGPSHGPVHREIEPLMEMYRSWAKGELANKVLIAYVSMWGSTKRMANQMAQSLGSRGVDVRVYDILTTDTGDIARDLVDAAAIVLGAPTVLSGMHPVGTNAAVLVRALRPPARYAAVLSSHGWSGGAMKQVEEVLGTTDLEMVGYIDVKGPATGEVLADVDSLAADLVDRMKG